MAFKKYNKLDEKRIEEIFAKNLNPSVHDVLKVYILECYPNSDETELRQIYTAAYKFARDHTWVKNEHNAQKKVLAWPDEKKDRFKQLYESGVAYKEIATEEMFKVDVESHGTVRHAMQHFSETLRCDINKRKEALKNQNKKEDEDIFILLTDIEREIPERLEQLNLDIINPNFTWKEIEDKYEFSRDQLKAYAKKANVTLNKSKNVKAIEKDYRLRLTELIKAQVLINSSIDQLLEQLRQEFPIQTENLSPETFKAQILEAIWDKVAVENLENCMRLDILEDFTPYNRHIPQDIIDDKIKELRGRSPVASPVTFRHGLGRLLDDTSTIEDEKFKLPASTFKRPFKIATKNKKSWAISFPNSPHIGTIYNPIMRENPLRRAFADAEAHGDDAVVLINIIDFDVRKASGSATKIFRSLISGLNINLDILDPSYRGRAAKILAEKPDDALIYETVAESFSGLMSGLEKIINWKDKLQYSGVVFVVLTASEQNIVAKATYMEERIITIHEIAKLNQKKRMLENKISDFDEDDDCEELQDFKHQKEILINEIARTIISLIHSQEDQRMYRRVLAFLVRKVEKALGPNCKVIGMGDSHIEVNGLLGELNIPESDAVTDTHLMNYINSFGGKSFVGKMPDFTVIMPSSSLCSRNGERERYVEGQRLIPSKVWVAPPLVDAKFLRRALNNTARTVHNLAKAVKNFQFNPGLLRLRYRNGDINSDYLSMKSLAPHERRKSVKDSRETYSGKFFAIHYGTDPHWGGRSKMFIYDEDNRRELGMVEASIEMMRRGGLLLPEKMRVHGYNMLDDGIQAHNFETQNEPSPNQMSFMEIQRRLKENAEKVHSSTDFLELRRLSDEKDSLIRRQFTVRGIDYTKHQMDEVFQRHTVPNLDYFHAMLSRVKDSGIRYIGLSEITGELVDTRDLGAVNYGTGNHLNHTVWGHMTEGNFYAEKLQDKLKAFDRWRDDPATVDKLVRAPIFSSEFFGLGRIALPGGYVYAVDFRGTPPRFASWGDTNLGWVRNDIFAGDMEGHMSGYFTIAACGDKHFYNSTYTDYKFYHMSASGSHTDQYGKKGFSPNNTGVSIILYPVDGPENGPIISRTLHAVYMKNYFKKPFDINWEELLPDTL